MRLLKQLHPMNDPNIAYLWAWGQIRVDRVRERAANDPAKSRGASAIEWAIITGILAAVAIAIGVTITKKIKDTANKIKTPK